MRRQPPPTLRSGDEVNAKNTLQSHSIVATTASSSPPTSPGTTAASWRSATTRSDDAPGSLYCVDEAINKNDCVTPTTEPVTNRTQNEDLDLFASAMVLEDDADTSNGRNPTLGTLAPILLPAPIIEGNVQQHNMDNEPNNLGDDIESPDNVAAIADDKAPTDNGAFGSSKRGIIVGLLIVLILAIVSVAVVAGVCGTGGCATTRRSPQIVVIMTAAPIPLAAATAPPSAATLPVESNADKPTSVDPNEPVNPPTTLSSPTPTVSNPSTTPVFAPVISTPVPTELTPYPTVLVPPPTTSTPRPTPVQAPTGNSTCVPTLGPCVKTNDQFRAAWRNVKTKGNVMAFCAGTTTLTSANLDLTPFPDQSTLCCGAGPITVASSSGTINTPCKVNLTGSQIHVTASDFTLRGLDLTRTTGSLPDNGGILSIVGNGTHRIVDSVFRNGRAADSGGNVYIETLRPGSNVYIDRSNFFNSSADDGGGLRIVAPAGGITVRIDTSTFFKTDAERGGGVHVWALSNAQITISNSRFTNCTTADCCLNTPLGAGFYVNVPIANRTITIQNNVFDNNNANGGLRDSATGGVGYIEDGNGPVTLRNNRGTNNQANNCIGILLESSAQGNTCFDVTDTYP